MSGTHREITHPVARRYPRVVRWLRWVLVVAWIAGAAAATLYLPKAQTSSGGLGGLVPKNSPAVQAEKESLARFGVPVLTNTMVVLHDPSGLPALTQADVVLHALAIDQQLSRLPRPLPKDRVLGALPILNTAGVFPGARATGTTAVTYLYFNPNTSLYQRRHLAQAYARHFLAEPGLQVAVTGSAPARVAESDLLLSHLTLVEIVTLAFVTLVVAFVFRSVAAPLVLLSAAVLSYLVGIRLLGLLGEYTALTLPSELEPLIIALVLGILTDYCVFFLSGMRDRMREGKTADEAFTLSVRRNVRIVFVAGLTVAVGTASLDVARVQLFRAFGPGLAVSVGVAALAALTFFPAVMAILGPRVFWPRIPGPGDKPPRERRPSWVIRLASRRFGAAIIGLVCVAGLGAAAYPLSHAKLDLSFITGLPHNAAEQRGARLVSAGFPRGVLAPTVLLVRGPNVTTDTAGLHALDQRLSSSPGVAGVIGPGSIPVPGVVGAFSSSRYHEVRYVLYFNRPALGGFAIADLRGLQRDMPGLLASSGLRPATWDFAGDTAIASETAHQTQVNLALILGVAFAAEYLILAVFLRALVAPLLLLASSGLVVAAALGLTTEVFQVQLGSEGLAFYVPFATSVLLISLGSDYNVFGAGRIWQDAESRPLRRAIRVALPEASRAITTAGMILAGSFAVIALIPLESFREMAFTMFVGLLLDTFVVRSLLTPALLTLVGPASGWPGHRLLSRRRAAAAQGGEPAVDVAATP